MKTFVTPEIEVLLLDTTDVITTSGGPTVVLPEDEL